MHSCRTSSPGAFSTRTTMSHSRGARRLVIGTSRGLARKHYCGDCRHVVRRMLQPPGARRGGAAQGRANRPARRRNSPDRGPAGRSGARGAARSVATRCRRGIRRRGRSLQGHCRHRPNSGGASRRPCPILAQDLWVRYRSHPGRPDLVVTAKGSAAVAAVALGLCRASARRASQSPWRRRATGGERMPLVASVLVAAN